MRVSARCEYACRALLELALHWPKREPLHIKVISKRQGIPMKYLVQILIQLKRMGFVGSIRGKQGGYILAEPPHRISLGAVIREIGGPLLPIANPVIQKESVFATIWREVEESMAKILDKITFEDICRKAKAIDKAIIYQI
jgi:Rrf2 family protein